jgi:hypothetical protein
VCQPYKDLDLIIDFKKQNRTKFANVKLGEYPGGLLRRQSTGNSSEITTGQTVHGTWTQVKN